MTTEEKLFRSKQTIQNEMSRNSLMDDHSELTSPWKCLSSKEDIRKLYSFHERIGEGFCGVVYRATPISNPNTSYAVKVLEKKKMNKQSWEYLQREIELIRDVECPFIVQFFECYEDVDFVYIVTEVCEGGDLVGHVENVHGVEEELAKRFFWQAATAVNYLHHYGIVHRDIKLDNFLLTSNTRAQADLKLIDFGFATFYRDKRLRSTIGTPFYVAPEVLLKNYSVECDVWSLGVMLYMMVFAVPPFKGKNNNQIFEQIRNKEVSFPTGKTIKVSSGLKELITGLLMKDPNKRMTLAEAFKSKWFHSTIRSYNAQWKPYLTAQMLMELKDIKQHSKFQKEVIRLIIKLFHGREEIRIRTHVFTMIDFKNTGTIDKSSLLQAYTDLGVAATEGECDLIIHRASFHDQPLMSFFEFAAATLDKKFFIDEEFLRPAFEKITGGESYTISAPKIKACFERFGYKLEDSVIKEFMEEFGFREDGLIGFPEFKTAIRKGL